MPEGAAAEAAPAAAGAAPAPAAAEAPGSAPAAPQPQIFVDESGNFKEGWRQTYVPDDVRSDKVFDGVKSLGDLTKMVAHAERTIRRQGKAMPEDTAPQSDWDVFYRSIGRPDTPEGYTYQKPEDIHVEDLSPEFMKATFEGFHKVGLSQKQSDGVLGLYADHLREAEQQIDEIEQGEFEEAERIIRAESGTAYDSRLHLANKMITDNTVNWPQEKRDKLTEALNENALKPYVMDFLSNIAGKFMEHKIIPESEYMGGKTPAQVEGEISELKATPGFILLDKDGKTLKNTNIDEYKRLTEKLHNLEDELRRMTIPKTSA